MNADREAIYTALFALVSCAASFVTASRRMQLITQMQPSQLPAIFQQQTGEETAQVKGVAPKYTLHVDIAIYAFNPDPSGSATPQLNGLIDAIEAALAPNPATGIQSLGGQVSHCYINGRTDIFEGDPFGNRAAAIIPIEIVTT